MSAEQTEIVYNYETYRGYDNAEGADKAKKIIEFQVAQRFIRTWKIMGGRSLDVGCASGRYPLSLAAQGFEATGYDISSAAIRFCKEKAAASPYNDHVSFAVRDFLKPITMLGRFNLVTSMMGTFNHITPAYRDQFLANCFRSLIHNGLLILSCWNPNCPYPGMLSFYSEAERKELLERSLSSFEMKQLLHNAGFSDVVVQQFCFLPDKCYDAWSEEIEETYLVDLDNYLYGHIPVRNAQMYIVAGTKKLV